MTPEEKAVIQAAIEWRHAIPGRDRDVMKTIRLEDLIWQLIIRCPECNAGGHVCPGDGNPIGHGDTDCGEHDEPQHDPLSGDLIPAGRDAELERQGRQIAEGREQIRRDLEEYALGVVSEWMRIIEIDSLPGQLRVRWQDHQGAFILGESQYGNEHGAFRLSVSVQDLGPIAPIGPEDDRRQVTCADCLERGNNQPQWVARTWQDVRRGDRVRLPDHPEHVAEVESAIALPWHVHPVADPYRPQEKRAQWREIKVRLHDRDGLLSMNPSAPIEIELTPSEVAAIEALGGWHNRVRTERS